MSLLNYYCDGVSSDLRVDCQILELAHLANDEGSVRRDEL